MTTSTATATFACDIQSVWDTVTSLEETAWRSDLGRIEVLNDRQFVEYTEEGYATTFTVTAMEPCRRWEFDLNNDNIKGHWTGIFMQKGEQTEISFTEEITVKKPLLKLFMKPYLKAYLKKQQAQYISDLRRALSL